MSVTQQHLPLRPSDQATLDQDRAFVPTVLEAHFPQRKLTGTSEDLFLFQEMLSGGPYSETPGDEVIAFGTALGDVLAASLGLQWIRYIDEHGEDLALLYPGTSTVIFPRSMILKRVADGRTVEFEVLFRAVSADVKKMAKSGDYPVLGQKKPWWRLGR